MLSLDQKEAFERDGHVTVEPFMVDDELGAMKECLDGWEREYAENVAASDERWYFEGRAVDGVRRLRKLDQPVFHQTLFRDWARSTPLVSMVESLIGPGVTVFFSQVFCKPPEVGGAKPAHQDNFYFGPSDLNGVLTVWLALDDATCENGCLSFVDGSHLGPVVEHSAPPDEPFNLQIDEREAGQRDWKPAPVRAGGVSLHHGNTWHRSLANTSSHARRAAALHYRNNNVALTNPALTYESQYAIRVSE